MAKRYSSEKRFSLLKPGFVAASLVFTGVLFTGCGDDGGTMKASSQMEAKISGMVSDNKGPIESGRIEVKDKNGMTLTTTDFSGGRYSVTVPAGATYPISLTAHPASGGGSMEPVKAAVTSAIADRQDISSVTTYIVDNAMTLGGLTNENIAKASGGAIGMRQSQGVSAAAGGGGAGPGQSGGGAGQGGHAGHKMPEAGSGAHDMSKMNAGEGEGQK
jgi:hypothetical protein